MTKAMKLSEYLEGIRNATTCEEFQAALTNKAYPNSFKGPSWTKICKARIETGYRIIDAHPHGRFVPKFGPGRKLHVCGETYGVPRGGNSTGVRYAWHDAKTWAVSVMHENGLSIRASYKIWDQYSSGYPHRALADIEKALAGEIPDPVLDVLCEPYVSTAGPIKYDLARNDADEHDKRAHRPCPVCGGTLFDWGAGWSYGFDFINWHCNGCPNVYTEYLSKGRLTQIRQSAKYVAVEVKSNG